jgi:RHS repeat-associated protein
VNLPFYQRIPKLGRLTQESVIYPNTSAQNADYTYDLVGNRLTRANATAIDPALANQTLDYDIKDRFTTSGAPVSFDANGNSVTSASGTVTDYYDAENRLVKRTAPNSVTIRMVYDYEGNRVGKQVQTGSTYQNTYYLVDDKNPTGYAQVVFECRDLTATPNALNGTLYLAYAYGQNLISIRNSFGTIYYYGYDGQGSVRALLNTSGTISMTYTYDAWGNWLAPNTEPIDNHYRYTGQQYDIDLGLYYLRARYYSPQYGRFWTMDSYAGEREDPLSLHKFLYCGADPANRFDPTGFADYNLNSLSITMANIANGAARLGTSAARVYRFAKIRGIVFGVQRGEQILWALENADAIMTVGQLVGAVVIGGGIVLAEEERELFSDTVGRISKALTSNSAPIPEGDLNRGTAIERIALAQFGNEYLGGNVETIDLNRGTAKTDLTLSFKTHDFDSPEDFKTQIEGDLNELSDIGRRRVEGTTEGGGSYSRNVGKPTLKVLSVAIAENKISVLNSPEMQQIRQSALRQRIWLHITACRGFRGRR